MASILHSALSVWECGNVGLLDPHKNTPPTAWCPLSCWGTPSSLQHRGVNMILRECVGNVTLCGVYRNGHPLFSSMNLHSAISRGHWTFFLLSEVCSHAKFVCVYITFWVNLTAISLQKRCTLLSCHDSWSLVKMLDASISKLYNAFLS